MSDLRALIEAARADAPSTAAKANVWAGVSTVVGEAAMASGAGGSVATGSAGAVKMLVLGTLLGGSVTVGIGVAMLLVGHAPSPGPTVSVAAPAPAQEGAELTALAMPAQVPAPAMNRAMDPSTQNPRPGPALVIAAPAVRPAGFEASKKAAPHALPLPAPAVDGTESDTLAREAASLADARGALARRDALSALQIVRGLRALPGRQLVPEELAVEAQALRGLGLDDDASKVETHLRARFPDSVLGR